VFVGAGVLVGVSVGVSVGVGLSVGKSVVVSVGVVVEVSVAVIVSVNVGVGVSVSTSGKRGFWAFPSDNGLSIPGKEAGWLLSRIAGATMKNEAASNPKADINKKGIRIERMNITRLIGTGYTTGLLNTPKVIQL
jgi:hypothetical protein